MKKFKLDCMDANPAHVRFRVLDWLGANCGNLTIRTEDAVRFVAENWNGEVFWNGKIPSSSKKEVAHE